MTAMTVADFKTLTQHDFENGAVRDEIYTALKQREELLIVLWDLVADVVNLGSSSITLQPSVHIAKSVLTEFEASE